MKPIATVPRALATVDVATGEATRRTTSAPTCARCRPPGIVAEAMVALVLADAVAEKFGGDSVPETRRNVHVVPRQPGRSGERPRWSSWSARWASASPPSASCWPSGSAPAYRDTDADIVAAQGRAISEIFVDEGEPHFRALERAAVRDRARRAHAACWRSAAARSSTRTTRALLAGLPVVYLSMDVEEAVKRVGLERRRARCSPSTRASSGAS